MTEKLTPNNQHEVRWHCNCARCVAGRATMDADVLTPNNSNQPHGQESLAGEQVTPVTPFSTTTGSTTLLPDPQDIPVEIDQNHQSVLGEKVSECGFRAEDTKPGLSLADLPPFRLGESILDYAARISPKEQEVFEKHCSEILNVGFKAPRKKSMADWGKEKEAVRHSPDVHIKDFNTPAERVVPTSDKNYLDIVFCGDNHSIDLRFVEVEDNEGKSVSIGTWVEYGECNPRFWALRIPDHRHLQAELDKYRRYQEQYLTLTRKTQKDLETVTELLQAWKVDFIDSLTTLKKERDTANTMVKDLTEQYTELRDEYVKVKAQKDALITQDINHILASNQSLLEANRILRKELHAARSEAVVERQNPHAASGGDPVLRKLNEEFIGRAPGTAEGLARAVEEGKTVRIEPSNNGPYPDNLYEVPESGNLADLKELQEKETEK